MKIRNTIMLHEPSLENFSVYNLLLWGYFGKLILKIPVSLLGLLLVLAHLIYVRLGR